MNSLGSAMTPGRSTNRQIDMQKITAAVAGDRENVTPITPAFLSLAEKRDALEEVLQSVTFVRAEQLRSFLRYICEMEFSGRGKELCESLIGIEAFGRPADYSPAEDASVRRRAGDLRTKLQEAYSTELAGSSIRIELPKGKFIPRFVRVAPEIMAAALAPVKCVPAETVAIEYANRQFHGTEIPLRSETNLVAAHANNAVRLDGIKVRRLITLWFAAGWVVGALTVSLCLLAFLRTRPSGRQASQATVAAPAARAVAVEPGITYEAEANGNTMGGITEPFGCAWCSGGARVRNIGKQPQNRLTLNNVLVTKAGNYEMVVCYVLKGDRSFFIRVNDAPPIELALRGRSWLEVAKTSITVPLKAGNNSIEFYNDLGYAPDLDRVVIR